MGRLKETTFKEFTPRPSLRDYVDGIWYSKTDTPHTLHILPTTRSTLMTCTTPYGHGVVLVGALSTTQVVDLEQGNVKVGAWLKPGAYYLFSPYKPLELRDAVVMGRDMGQTIIRLETAIERKKTPHEKLECLQDFIEQLVHEEKIARHALVDSFVDRAREDDGRSSVKAITQDLPIGYRQSLRLIKHYTGFTAKEFLRLQRFTAAAHSLDATERSITTVAAAHTYADHSHFTREFRSRIGVTPSAFNKYQAL